jgi:heptosyltransferase-2
VQKFLVIQTAFIGDVVLATGLIEKLHAWFPEAQIDFLVRRGNETLLDAHPFLHETLVWDKKNHKLRNLWRLLRQIRAAKYDKVINVQRFAATGLLTAFSGAGETIGFDKNPFSRLFTKSVPHLVGGKHEIERNQLLIEGFTDNIASRPRLYPSAADEEAVRQYRQAPDYTPSIGQSAANQPAFERSAAASYITVSPASVWFTKQYPKEQWISFLRKLPASQKVCLLGGPADRQLCEDICIAVSGGTRSGIAITNLSGRLSFLQSIALMRGAAMNYVNDSAPLHFSSAVNAPVTAVYCSTIPAFGFGPLSDNSHIVEIAEPLDCRPCGLHGYKACPRGHFNCAHQIADEQLLATSF